MFKSSLRRHHKCLYQPDPVQGQRNPHILMQSISLLAALQRFSQYEADIVLLKPLPIILIPLLVNPNTLKPWSTMSSWKRLLVGTYSLFFFHGNRISPSAQRQMYREVHEAVAWGLTLLSPVSPGWGLWRVPDGWGTDCN